MHKIKRIRIRGAWSHVDTEVTIAPGLTVITGPSGAGKSSIIRAVRWVAFGEPSGEAFLYTVRNDAEEIVEQADEAIVEIETVDGVVVTKSRRKGKTRYQLSTMSEPFEKAEVPQEVTQVLGLTQQSFADFDTALNFAYQLDAPFLISEPASVGAKVLGKLAGTEIVDLATKAISKETHAARNARSTAEKEIEARDMDLLRYIGLEEIEAQIEAAEYLADHAAFKYQRQVKVSQLSGALGAAKYKIEEADKVLQRLLVLPELEADLANIEKAQQRYDRILDQYGRLQKAKADIERLESLTSTFGGLPEAALLVDRLVTISDKRTRLEHVTKQYQQARQSVKSADEVLERTTHLDTAGNHLQQAEDSLERFLLLRRLKNLQTDARLDISRADNALNYVGDLAAVQETISATTANIQRRDTLLRLRTEYGVKQQTSQLAEGRETDAARQIEHIQGELVQAWADLKVCPLCDQPVSNHTH